MPPVTAVAAICEEDRNSDQLIVRNPGHVADAETLPALSSEMGAWRERRTRSKTKLVLTLLQICRLEHNVRALPTQFQGHFLQVASSSGRHDLSSGEGGACECHLGERRFHQSSTWSGARFKGPGCVAYLIDVHVGRESRPTDVPLRNDAVEDSWREPSGAPGQVAIRLRKNIQQLAQLRRKARIVSAEKTLAYSNSSQASLLTRAGSGVSSDGLRMTVHPVARAGAIFQALRNTSCQ